MMRSKAYSYLTMMIALAGLCSPPLLAQQAGGQPGVKLLTAAFPDSQEGAGQTPVDTPPPAAAQSSAPIQTMTPISGVEMLAPTFGGDSHDFVSPAVGCTDHASTKPTGFERHASVYSETTCAASISLQKDGRASQFNLQDAGGAFFFAPAPSSTTDPNVKQYGGFDELGVTEQLSGRRWKLILGDQGMYLPETPMGFPGFAGIASFGAGMGGNGTSSAPAVNSAFQPNQGIYNGFSSRISDLAESEFQYVVSAHSTITASGMFGTLQSLSSGSIDDDYATVMAGYNRFFGRGDEAAVTYVESHYVFSGGNPGFATRGASFLYGHRFSPKLSVQLSIAPMVNEIDQAQGGSIARFFLSTLDSVNYRTRRYDANLSVDRSMSGGAGILAGSVRTMVRGSIGREFARRYHVVVQSSYSNNQSIAQAYATTRSYDYWEAGLNLSREFGPHISLYLNYEAERQVSNTPICQGTNCSTALLQQMAGFGFSWHGRALNVE